MRNYSRFSSLLFFGVFVQLLSVSSSASVFKLEYSGTISSFMQGNGMGFTVGDRVEGIMQFDLANSTGDILWLNYDANYRALAGNDFVTSTISPMIGNIPGTTDDNWIKFIFTMDIWMKPQMTRAQLLVLPTFIINLNHGVVSAWRFL